MKSTLKQFVFSVLIPVFFVVVFNSCQQKQQVPVNQNPVALSDFLGPWTIAIEDGSVGWIEVRQHDKYLDADLLWKGGSVTPVANVYFDGKKLVATRIRNVVREKDEAGNAVKSHTITTLYEFTRDGEKLTGTCIDPRNSGTEVGAQSFVATKLPPVSAAPDMSKVKFGEPVKLFNGTDLTGWKLTNEKQKNGFKVVDGVLENDPVQPEGGEHISYGNLRTEKEFEDFNLKLEVNVPVGSNSGVYLRGMYEIQVMDSYGKALDPHNMGALYSRITPSVAAEKKAGEWQTLDMTLCDRHLTVLLNGIKIIDNQPVAGPTGGAILSDVFSPGPIYLQGDHGKVSYRNIVLTPVVK
jgi:hypothetical protein